MKEHKRTIIITTIVTILPMLIGILLWNKMPDTIAIHWGANNQVDGWSSKPFAVFAPPLFLALVQIFLMFMVLNDPKRRNVGSKLMHVTFWIIPVVSWAGCGMTFLTAAGIHVNVEIAANFLVGLVFIVVGNYLPKSKQSYTVGVRLPWTLNSAENWNRTTRLTGKLFIVAGLCFLINTFLGFEQMIYIIIVVVLIVPIAYSFLLYKRGI